MCEPTVDFDEAITIYDRIMEVNQKFGVVVKNGIAKYLQKVFSDIDIIRIDDDFYLAYPKHFQPARKVKHLKTHAKRMKHNYFSEFFCWDCENEFFEDCDCQVCLLSIENKCCTFCDCIISK